MFAGEAYSMGACRRVIRCLLAGCSTISITALFSRATRRNGATYSGERIVRKEKASHDPTQRSSCFRGSCISRATLTLAFWLH